MGIRAPPGQASLRWLYQTDTFSPWLRVSCWKRPRTPLSSKKLISLMNWKTAQAAGMIWRSRETSREREKFDFPPCPDH